MFYMNHNDMESVFRDAAENYQVRTDKAYDWDKINNAVHKKTGGNSEHNKPQKKRKRRFVFWFFFLISISLFSYSIWRVELRGEWKESRNKKEAESRNEKAESRNEKDAVGKSENAEGISEKAENNKQSFVGKNNGDKKISASEKKEQTKNGIVSAENDADEINNKQQTAVAKNNLQQNEIKTSLSKSNSTVISEKDEATNLPSNKSNNNEVVANNNAKDLQPQPLPLNKPKEEEKINSDTSETSETDKTSLQKNTTAKKKSANKNEHGFYAGVQVSPDVTFIKFQKANGVGIEFGLTGGYQLNKKWSIETGVLLNTKKYYTKGEYFDKSNLWFPTGTELVSVTGECTMIEIPLNARYRFAANNKRNFSFAAGTSSYFMTKEYYDYSLMSGGLTETMEKTYHASSKSLLAVINLSAGYERKISNTLAFKVEPYFKVPVSGIGTGKLHMSSTGINLGVTKYFGKK